ncbi:hypothetical protein TNCV_168311 [Trichonephila clavipes]|nr:hypothetical protein TNCV_168311 [Trichonephila clavipes]
MSEGRCTCVNDLNSVNRSTQCTFYCGIHIFTNEVNVKSLSSAIAEQLGHVRPIGLVLKNLGGFSNPGMSSLLHSDSRCTLEVMVTNSSPDATERDVDGHVEWLMYVRFVINQCPHIGLVSKLKEWGGDSDVVTVARNYEVQNYKIRLQ